MYGVYISTEVILLNDLQVVLLVIKYGQKAKIAPIPILALQILRQITQMFQWTWNISARLAFTNMLLEKQLFNLSMEPFYYIFKTNTNEFNTLDNYLREYFSRILQKMKELNEQQNKNQYFDIF